MANLYDILAGAQHGEAMAEFGRAFGRSERIPACGLFVCLLR